MKRSFIGFIAIVAVLGTVGVFLTRENAVVVAFAYVLLLTLLVCEVSAYFGRDKLSSEYGKNSSIPKWRNALSRNGSMLRRGGILLLLCLIWWHAYSGIASNGKVVGDSGSAGLAVSDLSATPSPTPSATPVPSATPSPTPTPSATPVPSATPSPLLVSHGSLVDDVFYWQNFGADPFAHSLEEAMMKRQIAFRSMGLSDACIAEAIRVTNAQGTDGVLVNGDVLISSGSGSKFHRNVVVDFMAGIQAETKEWRLTCDGKRYVLILPRVCYNWSLADLPHNPCFAYHLDGRNMSNREVKIPMEVEVSFYLYDIEGDRKAKAEHRPTGRKRLEMDECFYAEDDVTGERLELSHDCDPCVLHGGHQTVWPSDVLQGSKTDYTFSIVSADGMSYGCPSGACTVYVPRWFVASSIWCFEALYPYDGKKPAWVETWDISFVYYSYHDTAIKEDVQVDMTANLPAFHRVLVPKWKSGE